MARPTRRTVLASIGGVTATALAGCSTGDSGSDQETTMAEGDGDMEETTTTTDTPTPEPETGRVRVAHMSPDAPNVDVYVEGDRVLSDVPFRAVSDYLEVPAAELSVKITAAGDESTVAFEGPVPVSADTDYTVAAIGELTSEDSEFRPLVLEDDNSDPGSDTARVRLVHAAPDAPAVDVTLAANGDALYDGVAFGESGYVEVPPGDYTLEVRGDTESNDGDVAASFDVSLSGGTVATAFAAGYLSPDDEPTEAAFDLTIAADASS